MHCRNSWRVSLQNPSLFPVGFVRTGRRYEERSAKCSALIAAADSPRHEATFVNFFPRFELVRVGFQCEMRRIVTVEVAVLFEEISHAVEPRSLSFFVAFEVED